MKTGLLALVLLLIQGAPTQVPGSIQGVVVRLGTSTPVPRARVSITNAMVLTDNNGRFVFQNIQPGRYRLTATHNAYVIADAGKPGSPSDVTLAPGQVIKDLVIALVPKGAISGRVIDSNGDPVTNATVQAMKYAYQDGQRILIPVDNARTNDRGEYRLFWLTPGPYVISATPQESACADAPCSVLITNTEVVSGPAPVIGGNVRLDGRVAIRINDGNETTLPVYFPGTTSAAAASPIQLAAGVDYTGVDLTIREAYAIRVVGRVVNGVTGQAISAANTNVNLVPRRGTVSTGSSQRALVSPNGTFELRHIAPGSYDLVASISIGGERLAASLPLEIGNRDTDAVTLVLQPQLSITGKLTIENLQPDNQNMSAFRVELRREPYTPQLLIVLPTVALDGTFTLAGVTPGEYRLKVGTGRVKGYVKSARYGAIDALNPPFRIDGPGQLEIVVGTATCELDAITMDEAQKPFPQATVVLVPDPPRRQRFDLYYAVASDSSGRVHLDRLAPGDYKLFAWDDVPSDAWQDPEFLRLYEDRGKPVHVSEGGRETVELRLLRTR